jgi:glycogen operon protein
VTTLSLLPVQHHLDEWGLAQRGLVNHWGYNTLAFNAADPRLATAAARGDPTAVNAEFRRMVDELHAAGLEVVLDVVYNHTAEGSEIGPTISMRGLDHASWYRLDPADPSRCENLTGCGNTLNLAHPRVTQFVLDSLRHWAGAMGVDGFRFDLAPVLGRAAHGGYDPQAAFFTALLQDPQLARKRLIAEPWDIGHAGYQLGRFPGRWLEWNDKFRDTARRYWLDRRAGRGEFARRFTASSDVFHHGQRLPLASVNFIAAHDGYTLADLTSYTRKRNHANGEGNRDGRDDEMSANFGVEGPSDDAAVSATRQRVRRALLATLLLAQGTPMLCAGDEIGHTQGGNNNAYCQDNETTWLDWARADTALADFVARVLALRCSEGALRHARWFHPPPAAPGERVLAWHSPEGPAMRLEDWHDPTRHAFACHIDAAADDDGAAGARGERHLWIGFNPGPEPCPFALPPAGGATPGAPPGPAAAPAWDLALDSSGVLPEGPLPPGATTLVVPAQALVVLRRGPDPSSPHPYPHPHPHLHPGPA